MRGAQIVPRSHFQCHYSAESSRPGPQIGRAGIAGATGDPIIPSRATKPSAAFCSFSSAAAASSAALSGRSTTGESDLAHELRRQMRLQVVGCELRVAGKTCINLLWWTKAATAGTEPRIQARLFRMTCAMANTVGKGGGAASTRAQ